MNTQLLPVLTLTTKLAVVILATRLCYCQDRELPVRRGRGENESKVSRSQLPILHSPAPLDFRNTLTGNVVISTTNHLPYAGSPVAVRLQLDCDGGFTHVYDAFFCTGDAKRAQLRVFDENWKYLGVALHDVQYDELGRGRWLYIQMNVITGRRVMVETGEKTTFTTVSNPAGIKETRIAKLGVGKYSLQFAMMGRYLDYREEGNDEPQSRRGINADEEICHSNVLEIEVLQQKVEVSAGKTISNGLPGHSGAESPRKVPFSAMLAVENPIIKAPGAINFSIAVVNETDRSAAMMNPLNPFPYPCETTRLLVLDVEGKTVGDLFGYRKMTGGGSLTASLNWITLPPAGVYGIKDSVRANVSSFGSDLPPGKYKLQMAFLDRFASNHPYAGLPPPEFAAGGERNPAYVERLKKWRHDDYSGNELFRSNAVEINVVAAR